MKTSVIEVHDMLSVLSVDEVENRMGAVPGVGSVTVNYAAGNATVRYDETRLDVADIKSAVRQRGYESVVSTASAGADSSGTEQQDKTVPLTTPAPSPAPLAVAPDPAPADLAESKQQIQTAPDKI